MPGTYVKIQSVTVTGATQAAIEFTSIPGTFDDLVIFASLRSNETTVETNATISFNGSGANKSARTLYGNGTSALSYTYNSEIYIWLSGGTSTASTFGSAFYYIPNYAGSTNKSVSIDSTMEANITASTMALTAGLWSNSAAISSITITCGGGSFVTNSSATLYGIKKS
jgi:hypothetical protein